MMLKCWWQIDPTSDAYFGRVALCRGWAGNVMQILGDSCSLSEWNIFKLTCWLGRHQNKTNFLDNSKSLVISVLQHIVFVQFLINDWQLFLVNPIAQLLQIQPQFDSYGFYYHYTALLLSDLTSAALFDLLYISCWHFATPRQSDS